MTAGSLTRSSVGFLSLLSLLAAPAAALSQTVIVGENVNMVSGTGWPGGDPFLQRQNEPSVAISSVNPQHLLAGANDYRAVDLPNPTVPKMWGDAWLGVFKSFDGGQTWKSVLLPGYPQDVSDAGRASPLYGFNAGSDPVVRPGTDGMFYYSGIVFNRDTGLGEVFVARYIDLNNKENGDATKDLDPIRYLDATAMDTGTSGQFLDKPWLATDIPRAGAGTCTIPTNPPRSFPAGNVYFIYSTFTGNSASPSSKIMFTRSVDCGKTWTNPVKLSESNAINQGTTLAVDPRNGDIHVAWRRFATTNQADTILYAKSTDFGRTFTKAQVVSTIAYPFDQPGGAGVPSFRSNGFPTMAISVDANNTSSWVHVAWTQRSGPDADARIVMTTWDDTKKAWPPPVQAVDVSGFRDDKGNLFTRGHQLMPALTFNQGLLMLLYYDSHLDHTTGYFTPNSSLLPDLTGRYYTEERGPFFQVYADGSPVFAPADTSSAIFTPFIQDINLNRRHTIDVRVAQAAWPQAAWGQAPSFSSVRVSNFLFGQRGDETKGLSVPGLQGSIKVADQVAGSDVQVRLQQLQYNPPNLPMFAKGTAAFIGDYIDIAGRTFVRTDLGGWAFDTAPSTSAMHYAVWTSNQDVRPPKPEADGTFDWTKYTPPASAITAESSTSLFDPTQTRQTCVESGYEGTRNQNIYGARISSGLAVSSPQNVKPLGKTLTRAFVVAATNATSSERTFRMRAAPSPNVWASFTNFEKPFVPGALLPSLDVTIPAHSSVFRSVFVLLDDNHDPAGNGPAFVKVSVDEVGGSLSGFLTLNPPGSAQTLTQPDGSADDIQQSEVYDPTLSSSYYENPFATTNLVNTNFVNTNFVNTNFVNTNLVNTNLVNTNFVNTNLVNTNFVNTNFVNTSVSAAHTSSALNTNFVNTNFVNTNLVNTNFVNTNFVNTNLVNTNFVNTNFVNATISDTSYVVTNAGNTTHSYHVRLVGKLPSDVPAPSLQLILSKSYATPLALGCQLVEEPHPALVATVPNPTIQSPSAFLGDLDKPNIPDSRPTNATLSLAPGESAVITLRGYVEGDDADSPLMKRVTSHLSAVVVAHAGGYSSAFLITTDDTNMPRATVGQPYGVTLQATGGRGGNVWSFPSDGVKPPSWLTWVNEPGTPPGTIGGIPDAPGTVTFTVRVTDSTGGFAQRELTLIVKPATTASLTSSPSSPSTSGQPVTFTASVTPASCKPTGAVTFKDGATALGTVILPLDGSGVATLPSVSLATGTHTITAAYPGNDSCGSSSSTLTQVVSAGTNVVLGSAPRIPPSPVYSQPVSFNVTVSAVDPGEGAPGGTVTFTDGATSVTQDLAGGSASWSPSLGVGDHSVVVTYSGDTRFPSMSSSALSFGVAQAGTTVVLTSAPSSPSIVGSAVGFTATVSVTSPGTGTPPGSVTFTDNGTAPPTTATVTLGSDGKASWSPPALSLGEHLVVASYPGNANFAGSATTLTQSVIKASTTVIVSPSTPNPSTYGHTVDFSADVSSPLGGLTGTIAFKEGSTVLGPPEPLAGSYATFKYAGLTAGTHTITAEYTGDATHATSTGTFRAHTVNEATTTTSLASSATTANFGAEVTLTASVNPYDPGPGTTVPTGAVTFTDTSTTPSPFLGTKTLNEKGVAQLTTSSIVPGVRSIAASYSGDTNFLGSFTTLEQTVKATTTTTLASSSNPSTYGQSVTFTATVAPVPSGSGMPGGTVTFTDNGNPFGGSVQLVVGVAKVTKSFTVLGGHTIVATYSGDSTFVGSTSGPFSQTVKSYNFTGFLTPLKTAGTWSEPTDSGVQKIGSAIPVKWQLKDGTGAFIADLGTAKSISIFRFTCGPFKPLPDGTIPAYVPYDSLGGAKGNSTFRFGSNTYIFNWDTGAGSGVVTGCYEVVLELKDGTRKATNINLK